MTRRIVMGWHLRQVMAARGIYQTSELVPLLAERDALVLACEARAATALRSLTENEGLSLREAVQWCGGVEQLTVREAARLRKVEATGATPGVDAQPAPAGALNEPAQHGGSEPATSGPQVVGTG